MTTNIKNGAYTRPHVSVCKLSEPPSGSEDEQSTSVRSMLAAHKIAVIATNAWYNGRNVFGRNGLWYTTIRSMYMNKRQLLAAMSNASTPTNICG
eukprot:5127430-Pleurochrysis_carterae.AAC.1